MVRKARKRITGTTTMRLYNNSAHDVALLSEMAKQDDIRPLIHFTNQPVHTTNRMYEKGIWACPECGQLNNLESFKCRKCGDEKFILKTNE